VLASAAAFGAVASGTFTAFVADGETTATAVADESPLAPVLTTSSSELAAELESADSVTTAVLPVDYTGQAEDPGADTDNEPLELLGKAADLAAEIAQLHAEQAREQAERERVDAMIAKGGLNAWVAEALQIMDLPQSLAPSIKRIIMAESGGNPRAINRWDANARRGTPSQGLMQTIPSTFRAYVHPDLADRPITDPVANITAGVRYMITKYGMDTLEAGGRIDHAGDYVGY
jgi:hypothetical protein